LEFLATALRQEQEIKGIQIGREEIKLSLYADGTILYQRDPKDFIKKIKFNHKLFQQSSRIQNYHAEISSFFLYKNNAQNEK
jgi:hypothetical protein